MKCTEMRFSFRQTSSPQNVEFVIKTHTKSQDYPIISSCISSLQNIIMIQENKSLFFRFRFFKEKDILKTLNEKYLSIDENYDAWKEELRKILQSRVLDNSSICEDFKYLRDRRFLNPGFLLEVLKNVDPLAVRFIQRNRWHRRCQRKNV